MQTIIKDLIKQMSNEGMDKNQIALYLQGMFDGMNSFLANCQNSKLIIQPKENDPLFIHTWNHVIDSLTIQTEKIIQQVSEEIPKELLKQLKVGGRMVLPAGRKYESQDIVVIDKVGENKFKEKRFPGFVFVPLIKE